MRHLSITRTKSYGQKDITDQPFSTVYADNIEDPDFIDRLQDGSREVAAFLFLYTLPASVAKLPIYRLLHALILERDIPIYCVSKLAIEMLLFKKYFLVHCTEYVYGNIDNTQKRLQYTNYIKGFPT